MIGAVTAEELHTKQQLIVTVNSDDWENDIFTEMKQKQNSWVQRDSGRAH